MADAFDEQRERSLGGWGRLGDTRRIGSDAGLLRRSARRLRKDGYAGASSEMALEAEKMRVGETMSQPRTSAGQRFQDRAQRGLLEEARRTELGDGAAPATGAPAGVPTTSQPAPSQTGAVAQAAPVMSAAEESRNRTRELTLAGNFGENARGNLMRRETRANMQGPPSSAMNPPVEPAAAPRYGASVAESNMRSGGIQGAAADYFRRSNEDAAAFQARQDAASVATQERGMEEGMETARRNQALIEGAPAAAGRAGESLLRGGRRAAQAIGAAADRTGEILNQVQESALASIDAGLGDDEPEEAPRGVTRDDTPLPLGGALRADVVGAVSGYARGKRAVREAVKSGVRGGAGAVARTGSNLDRYRRGVQGSAAALLPTMVEAVIPGETGKTIRDMDLPDTFRRIGRNLF